MNNKILLISAVALALCLTACDDEVMDWGTPDGHYMVDASEIPLEVSAQLACYDYIKAYAPAGFTVGLGLTADTYTNDETYRQVCDDNFQIFTCGNAMKQGVVVGNSGAYSYLTIDPYLAALDPSALVYGHNFIWHTQQNQTYLKTLVAPDATVSIDDDAIDNLVTNSGFEDGNATGYTGLWGKYEYSFDSPGYDDSDYCLAFTQTDATANNWDCQVFWVLNTPLENGKTYAYSFMAKSDAKVIVEFLGQDSGNSNGFYEGGLSTTSEWKCYAGYFTFSESKSTADIVNVGIQFGNFPGSTLWIDDFQFGELQTSENPDLGRTNLLPNGTFDNDADGWSTYNGGTDCRTYCTTDGNFGIGCMQVVTDEEHSASGQQWLTQIHADLTETPASGETVYISYYIKTASGNGSIRISTNGEDHYEEDVTVTPVWQRVEWEFESGGSLTGICLDLGAVVNTYFIDDIIVSTDPFPEEGSVSSGGISTVYRIMDDEDKRANLLEAMESWIADISTHIQDQIGDRLVAWDVINEPILDGGGGYRGIDGFGGTANDGTADSTPVETESTGLNLNWASDTGNQHFYWGYYLGMEYATKAFEYAREYNPNALLFVNDYNLENSEAKLAKLIEFVNYIDQNGSVKVDGIGTQMHVELTTGVDDAEVQELNEKIDQMFRTLAATGKIIRVTELDVSLNTASPSSTQLAYQSDVYQHVVEAYLTIIPSSQQSGITFWTLTDSADEHEYWLPDCSPNLFDKNYKRKHAYKGVCNGLAGYDVSETFDSSLWYLEE